MLRDQQKTRQSYLRNTAILETILTCESGSLRVLDWAPRYKQQGELFRPPIIIRRIEPLEGRCHVKIRARPTFDYGATQPVISVGSNYLRYAGGNSVIRLTTDMPPAEPPCATICLSRVKPAAIRCRAAEMKSWKVFCFFSRLPCVYQR